jgi:response regulator of citrate/malate metabolism
VKDVTAILLLLEEFSSDRKMQRRSNTFDASLIARLEDLVDQDASRSMRSLAKKLDISEFTVRKKIAQDIRCKVH